MKNQFLTLIFLVFCGTMVAQEGIGYGFVKDSSLAAYDSGGNLLRYAFAGGMNNCQFGSLDVDRDGAKDLVVFDRHGNRVMVLLRQWIGSGFNLVYSPYYSCKLPAMQQWMILADYDNDGKEDIFTYTIGGIKVYRNTSGNTLAFEQVTRPYLLSQQGSVLTNILVTSADYPGIADVDGDGDLDILTFWGLGSFVQMHKNLSVETYGNTDSLVFQKVSDCWGHFAEGEENNTVKLDTCVEVSGNIKHIAGSDDPKHTGSTFLVQDFNKDGLPDLSLGDVDFSGLIQLTNGGTLSEAHMVSASPAFPAGTAPVNLVSFPAACSLDVDNDGLDDLLVSPFDPSLIRSESSHSSWFYKAKPDGGYQFVTDCFLQGEMLDYGSGAYPALFDYNNDGLMDLIVGNYGVLDTSWYDPLSGLHCEYVSSLALLENTGTLFQPVYKLITRDLAGLSELKMQSLIPAVGDLDGDGIPDLLCGNSKGKLVFCKNIAPIGQPALFQLIDPAYQNIDAGDFSAPQIIDLDGDQLPDLVIGKRNGRLSYYHNNGPATNPVFVWITDTLGGVNVTNTQESYYGYSTPSFLTDQQGRLLLLVGSESGAIFSFGAIHNNLDGIFKAFGKLQNINEGCRTAVVGGFFTGDTLIDLIVGNFSGGLGFFTGSRDVPFGIPAWQLMEMEVKVFPNPTSDRVNIRLEGIRNLTSVHIELVDGYGNTVYRMSASDTNFVIPVHQLASGIYAIVIKAENRIVTKKILVN